MPSTALILAGAGARGIIQAGMIRAFVDLGLEYDALYGSSVGALNGAMLHAGQIEDLIALWMNVRNKDVYTWAPWNMFRKNKGCLYDSTPLLKTIEEAVDFKKLWKNPKQFWVNVTNLSNGVPMRGYPSPANALGADLGSSAKVLWASASPPILMAPVACKPLNHFEILMTDGGLTNNYSIIDAVHDGADRLIILAPSVMATKPIRNIIDSIDVTISIQLWNQLGKELKAVALRNDLPGYRKIDITLVTAKVTDIGILDFDIKDKQDAINYGYEVGMKALTPLTKGETK